MQRILIYGDSIQSVSEVRLVLEANSPFKTYAATEFSEALNLLDSQSFNLVIYETDSFRLKDYERVRDMRDHGYAYTVLVVAREVEPIFFENRDQSKLQWIPKPPVEKDLMGLVRKLISAKKVPQQMDRRYHTDQLADFESLSGGECILSNMYNLSRGGAYCEYSGDTTVSVGDFVRVRVRLADVQKMHTINAKVVWTTRRGRFSGRNGVGLKFVKPADVHRYLMEKV